uniref:Uncharacterized protein n=1 Tax=Manihot esculenta TaxID=3983 RepID=A0A2C9WG33_MANES
MENPRTPKHAEPRRSGHSLDRAHPSLTYIHPWMGSYNEYTVVGICMLG